MNPAWIGVIGTGIGAALGGGVSVVTTVLTGRNTRQARFNDLRIEAYAEILEQEYKLTEKDITLRAEGRGLEMEDKSSLILAYNRALLVATPTVAERLLDYMIAIIALVDRPIARPVDYRELQKGVTDGRRLLREAAQAEWGMVKKGEGTTRK